MIGAVSYSSVQADFSSKTEGISRLDEQTFAGTENLNADATQASSKQTISNLARQLAASTSRAEERDKTLTRSELADKAKAALSQIQGDTYFANKAKHDAEIPKTSDPELLARAKQATEFVNRSSNNCPVSITLAGRRQLSWPVEARHDGFSLSSLTLVFCSAQTGRAPSVQSGGGSFPRSSRRWWSDAPVDRQPPASWPVLRTRDPSPRTADLR